MKNYNTLQNFGCEVEMEKDMFASLHYIGNDNKFGEIAIEKQHFSIGSAKDNDFVIEGGNVSRYHAEIFYDKNYNRFMVKDLKSTNGTYLQGKKLESHIAIAVSEGDYIQFSKIAFQFLYKNSRDETIAVKVDKVETGDVVVSDYDFSINADNKKLIKGTNDITYRLDANLKQGGMGTLYKATRLLDQTEVVIKFLPEEELENSKSVFRFISEAKTIIDLKHENIVKGFDLYHDLKKCFFVMEYIKGPSVYDLLVQERYLDVKQATDITLQITKALTYLERKKVYHRDIKPANIIWANDLAVLVDFGIAKIFNIGLTSENYVMGTAYYISPEQLSGAKLDIRTDIYSLGATYYHMATGIMPFTDQGFLSEEVLSQRFYSTPKSAHLVNPDVPKSVSKLLDKMMTPSKDDRIGTDKLITSLEKILSKEK